MPNQNNRLRSLLQKNKWILWGMILTITLLWGYAWVLMKEGLEYMGPLTFSAFRFTTGTLTLLVIVWIAKIGLPPKKYWKPLIIVGLLQTAVVFSLVMYALEFVDAGKSSVLLYSMPIWSSLFAVKFLGEKVTPPQFAGLFIGLLGLLTILGWDVWVQQNLAVIFGEVLIIIAAISWGLSNTYYRLKLQKLPQLQVSAYQMLFGTLGLVGAALISEWNQPIDFNMHSMYYILFTGVLASALCFTVWFIILNVIDMVTATISTLLVPVFGLLFSNLLLNEQLTAGVMVGSALIISGIVLANLTKQKRSAHHDTQKNLKEQQPNGKL